MSIKPSGPARCEHGRMGIFSDQPRMEVRLGEVVARCPVCAASSFVHVDPGEELNECSLLICPDCETPVVQAMLILRIGAAACAEAAQRLSEPH